jgi:hypothetical protein
VRRFIDVLLGRTQPVKSQVEKLFAMSTAQLTLETAHQLRPAGRAGICFRPVTSSDFTQMESELRDLLKLSGRESGSTVETTTDPYGFQWVVIAGKDFDDLVATIHLVSLTLHDGGFGEQLLAAVFRFDGPKGPVFWIYNYKRGTFYPFIPQQGGAARARENATELRLANVMGRELPVEQDFERWYALWGIPV